MFLLVKLRVKMYFFLSKIHAHIIEFVKNAIGKEKYLMLI